MKNLNSFLLYTFQCFLLFPKFIQISKKKRFTILKLFTIAKMNQLQNSIQKEKWVALLFLPRNKYNQKNRYFTPPNSMKAIMLQ